MGCLKTFPSHTKTSDTYFEEMADSDQILRASRLVSYEVIHINSLSLSRNASSDHDPVVAVFDLSALE